MGVLRHVVLKHGLGLPAAVRAVPSAGRWLRRNLYVLLLLAPLLLYLPAIVFWSSPDRFAVVRSGSMEPEFSAGDLVFLRPVRQVEVGLSSPLSVQPCETRKRFRTVVKGPRGIDGSVSRVLHRVIAIDPSGDRFTTKGDANPEPDPFKVGLESLVGETTGFNVPLAGYATLFLQSRLGLIWLAIIALVSFYPTLTRLVPWARSTAHRALNRAVGLETEQLDRVAAGVKENREVLLGLSSSITQGLEAEKLDRVVAGVNENREALQELSSSIAQGLETEKLDRVAAGVKENREVLQELSSSIQEYVKSSQNEADALDQYSEASEKLD